MIHAPKAALPLMLLIMVASVSCKKQATYMNEGIITGYDVRACACCGGLMINFKGLQQPYRGEFYLIENSPAALGIDYATTFPVRMMADWTQDGTRCIIGGIGNTIRITRFKKL